MEEVSLKAKDEAPTRRVSGKPKPCRFSQAVGPPTSSSRASKQRFFGVLARFGVQYQPESLSSDDSDDALGQELPAMGSLPPLPGVGDVPPILFDSFLRETSASSTSSASSTFSTLFNSTVQVVSQPAAKRPLLAPPPPPPPPPPKRQRIPSPPASARTTTCLDTSILSASSPFLSSASSSTSENDVDDEVDVGVGADIALRDAGVFTRQELLACQARRYARLRELYQSQYLRLADDLRSSLAALLQERASYLQKTTALSPVTTTTPENHRLVAQEMHRHAILQAAKEFKTAGETKADTKAETSTDTSLSNHTIPESGMQIITKMSARCVIHRCPAPRLRPTEYCFRHIMHDPRQRLFKSCQHVVHSKPDGQPTEICGYPVLVSRNLPYCNAHIDLHGAELSAGLKKHATPRPVGRPPSAHKAAVVAQSSSSSSSSSIAAIAVDSPARSHRRIKI